MAAAPGKRNPVADLLREKFPDAIKAALTFRGEETIVIPAADLLRVCRVLREDPAFSFDFLTDLCGVHFPENPSPFGVVYHLFSFRRKARLRLKALLQEGEEAPSVVGIWPAAAWPEREAFDLFGIRFHGHPDLRRILMPDDFEGYPLRKDFPVEG